MKNRLKSRYVKFGLTIFGAGAALISLQYVVTNMDAMDNAFSTLRGILSPFIMGIVIAYLLCPIYNFIVRNVYRNSERIFHQKKSALRMARVIGSIGAITFFCMIVGGILWMVLPELIRSLINVVQSMPNNIAILREWLSEQVAKGGHTIFSRTLEEAMTRVEDRVVEWARQDLIGSLGLYMQKITEGVFFTFKVMLDFVVAIIVAVYLLNGKELFRAQARKIILALFKKEQCKEIFEFATFANRTFGGFINGKIIDSAIIGILCFIAMNIIGLPYPILISAIIGITNIIPFFGPFIGAIPSIVIILTISPIEALYFAIMVLVLQQLDGNVIGPRILGGTVGLPSFWVMFAIILGGGLFGFLGMFLGVPVFATFYYYFKRLIERRLIDKNFPKATKEYQDFAKYKIKRDDIV